MIPHLPYYTRLVLLILVALCPVILTGCGGRFSGPSGPAAITLATAQTELEAGKETQATVEVTDFSGRDLPQSSVTWESSDPAILTPVPDATSHSARLVAGQKGGAVTVTVRAGSRSATAQLNVKGPQPPEISFERDIQPILTQTCALPDCHKGPDENANEGLVLDAGQSYDHLVGVKANQVRSGQVLRVEPGQPDKSYMVAKLRNTQRQLGGRGEKMPLEGNLSEQDLAKIVQWITAGAARN